MLNLMQLVQSLTYNFILFWILFVTCPMYLMCSTALQYFLIMMNKFLQTKENPIYEFVGDISWIIPFKEDKDVKLVHLLLLANLLALLSILIMVIMFWVEYQDNQNAKLERLQNQVKEQKNKLLDKKNN